MPGVGRASSQSLVMHGHWARDKGAGVYSGSGVLTAIVMAKVKGYEGTWLTCAGIRTLKPVECPASPEMAQEILLRRVMHRAFQGVGDTKPRDSSHTHCLSQFREAGLAHYLPPVGPSSLLPVFISSLSGTRHVLVGGCLCAAAAELTCCKSPYGPRRLN